MPLNIYTYIDFLNVFHSLLGTAVMFYTGVKDFFLKS